MVFMGPNLGTNSGPVHGAIIVVFVGATAVRISEQPDARGARDLRQLGPARGLLTARFMMKGALVALVLLASCASAPAPVPPAPLVEDGGLDDACDLIDCWFGAVEDDEL